MAEVVANDIMITRDGDIVVSKDTGDIQLTHSLQQAILIHLRWFFSEWRLGPEYGFPYWEDVFIKNPDLERIKRDIRTEIMKIDGIISVSIDSVNYDSAKRRVSIIYTASTDYDTFSEEVELYG